MEKVELTSRVNARTHTTHHDRQQLDDRGERTHSVVLTFSMRLEHSVHDLGGQAFSTAADTIIASAGHFACK